MRSPRRDFLFMQNRSRPHLDDIDDRVPLTIKLANLLGVDFQQHGDRVILPGALSVHRSKVEPPARNRVEDAHQRALRVAIADMKDLHVEILRKICSNYSASSNTISESAAPAGTMG